MSTIHVRVQTIEDKIAKYVEDNGIEIYIDYNDSLSTEQVDSILAGNADDVRCDIEMDYDPWHEGEESYWEECREATGASQDDIDDWLQTDDSFYPQYYLDDHGWRQLIRNTSVYITASVPDATWFFNNWAYGSPIEYRDFKESLKILGVNPKEFMELKSGGGNTTGEGKFKGWWPDMPDRVPKVVVKDLFEQMIVLYDGSMNFLLGDLEDVIEVLASDSKNLTVKKGTPMVMYDHCNGAGIVDIELIEDLTIPRKMVEFRNDKSNRYGIQECYGFVSSYWNEGSIHNAK